jgi:FtsP/CotA-like multicopper oxidase with cupredoxin domain
MTDPQPTSAEPAGDPQREAMRAAAKRIDRVNDWLHVRGALSGRVQVLPRDTAGVIKDVVMLGGFQELEIDFVADNPGLTLFHCHQQLHMDFGFMALFDYA